MSDSEPIVFRPRTANTSAGNSRSSIASGSPASSPTASGGGSLPYSPANQTVFNRQELSAILAVYGRKVASGEWRDYAIDLNRDKAVFSVFRRTSEVPLYRIEKDPKLARKQGAYSVVAAGGLILKRGHDLVRVLGVFDKGFEVVGR